MGAYRIVRLLGEGGMGAVYEARQEPLDRRVALKTLHAEHATNQESIARFFNEAKVLSRLEHPSIVQVSDFGYAADGTAYLVMEYLRGQSMAQRIDALSERGQQMPIATALQMCVQVADVLVVAHAQGIVHRDLKPANLMLVADPVAPGGERVKVLDFGIAKLTDDRGRVKTATNQMMGTPAYMSPEQCKGAGGVDAQTDVYALGCVLYELLSGRTPFVAEGGGELIGMHLFKEPPPLRSVAPAVPTETAELVHRMLRKDKTQRPTMKQAGGELAKQLSKQTGGAMGVVAAPQSLSDLDEKAEQRREAFASTIGRSVGQSIQVPARTQRGKVLLGAASVTTLVTGLLAVLWVSMRPAAKPQPTALSAKSSEVVAPVHNNEVPDLGQVPARIVRGFTSAESKSDEVTTPASEPGKNAKGKTPAVVKKPTSAQPVRPGSNPPTKKRFGYEE